MIVMMLMMVMMMNDGDGDGDNDGAGDPQGVVQSLRVRRVSVKRPNVY